MVSHRSGCQNMCARLHWLHWSWLFVGQSWTHGSAGIREILWGIINLINNDQDGAQGGWCTAGVLSCCLSWWSFEARHSQSLVLWSLKNYELQWVGGASCCLLRFGEELVQIWCRSGVLEHGHNQSLVQWIQDRGLYTAETFEDPRSPNLHISNIYQIYVYNK